MNAKLYIDKNGVAFDFETTEDRDLFFENMAKTESMGFAPQYAARKRGGRTIELDHTQFPFGYVWPVVFPQN